MSSPVCKSRDTLLASASAALRRAAEYLLCAAASRRLLVRRTHGRHHARIRLHPAAALAAPARRTALESADRARSTRPCASILERQLPDGGFNIYAGGPSEVSATVKAYCALKLAGIPLDDPRLRARASASWRWAAAGGQQLRQDQPEPVRPVSARARAVDSARNRLLPGNVLYEMSSWTRSILVPLSIVQARESATGRCPAGFTLDELLLPGVSTGAAQAQG